MGKTKRHLGRPLGTGRRRGQGQTHSLEKTRGGPAKATPPLPHPPLTAHTPIPKGCGAPWGQAGYCANLGAKGAVPGRQIGDRTGPFGETPSRPPPLNGRCVAAGAFPARAPRVLFLPLAAQAGQSQEELRAVPAAASGAPGAGGVGALT